MLAPASTRTSPISTAVGARKTSSATCGRLPLYSIRSAMRFDPSPERPCERDDAEDGHDGESVRPDEGARLSGRKVAERQQRRRDDAHAHERDPEAARSDPLNAVER